MACAAVHAVCRNSKAIFFSRRLGPGGVSGRLISFCDYLIRTNAMMIPLSKHSAGELL